MQQQLGKTKTSSKRRQEALGPETFKVGRKQDTGRHLSTASEDTEL